MGVVFVPALREALNRTTEPTDGRPTEPTGGAEGTVRLSKRRVAVGVVAVAALAAVAVRRLRRGRRSADSDAAQDRRAG